jgi:phosphate/sulfate permease
MELYLVILIILGILAISDLVVGVANDAVNFLNSAIGSKVAPRHVIMIVASIGLFIGAAFSSGMMEIARKGVFNPSMFYFEELMFLFLAVMFTDIILLDWFNTYGLPTSTTVSIIFELIGATFGISLYKVLTNQTDQNIFSFFNIQKIAEIVSGIFLSIVVAFTLGSLIQFIARTFFTFDVKSSYKKYAAFWCALSTTGIISFILLKGGKGSLLISEQTADYIKNNFQILMLSIFLILFIIFQLITLFTKYNIFKFTVLFGTFALALAFAGNDLVNFIGAPLAGYHSYIIASKSTDYTNLTMEALAGKLHAPSIFLIAAGVIMAIVLWFSKKTQTVTKTEVNLSRQYEGYERFESSYIARIIVRMFYGMFVAIKKILPKKVVEYFRKRLDVNKQVLEKAPDGSYPSFDLVRAMVNLAVSSSIISLATSYKLPLSTTYVTFMVAMGTSFADKAWGRESAVYRINGVITVISGWFLTALFAFLLSSIFSLILIIGKIYSVLAIGSLVVYIIIKTAFIHKKIESEISSEEKLFDIAKQGDVKTILKTLFAEIENYLCEVGQLLETIIIKLNSNDRTELSNLKTSIKESNKKANKIISHTFKLIRHLDETTLRKGKRFGKLVASIKEISMNLKSFHNNSLTHLDNNHIEPRGKQAKDLLNFVILAKENLQLLSEIIKNNDLSKFEEYEKKYASIKEYIVKADEEEINRIKNAEVSSNTSSLFFNLIFDGENIIEHAYALGQNFKKNFSSILN